MTTSPSRVSLLDYVRTSWRILLKEVTAFGTVGIFALGIDLGVFAWLSPHGALKAKAISTIVATTFAYVGNRHVSFSHRARTSLGRETSYFFGINLITLAFSEVIIAIFVYPLHFKHGGVGIFVVNLVTIGLSTIFRFWSYKRFVFLHPDRVQAHHIGTTDIDREPELAE